MTGLQDEGHAVLVDLAGRIMLTHGIDPVHAMRLLSIDRAEAEDMSISVDCGRQQALFAQSGCGCSSTFSYAWNGALITTAARSAMP